MEHEHDGHCCGQIEEHFGHQHAVEAMASMGQLCCAGQCQHLEHQSLALMAEQYQQLVSATDERSDTKKKKKNKKKLGRFGLSMANNELSLASQV